MVPRERPYCRARSRVAGRHKPGRRRPSRIPARTVWYSQRNAGVRESRGERVKSKLVVRLGIKWYSANIIIGPFRLIHFSLAWRLEELTMTFRREWVSFAV